MVLFKPFNNKLSTQYFKPSFYTYSFQERRARVDLAFPFIEKRTTCGQVVGSRNDKRQVTGAPQAVVLQPVTSCILVWIWSVLPARRAVILTNVVIHSPNLNSPLPTCQHAHLSPPRSTPQPPR